MRADVVDCQNIHPDPTLGDPEEELEVAHEDVLMYPLKTQENSNIPSRVSRAFFLNGIDMNRVQQFQLSLGLALA